MTADRKKPGVAFWGTVVLVALLVMYPVSWGPACRLRFHDRCPTWAITIYDHVYAPIFFINRNSTTAYAVAHWYLWLWGADEPT